mgnify:FL=1
MDRRPQFLAAFLGALGAMEVQLSQISPDSVSGIVVYDRDDAEEQQAFAWPITVSNAPSIAAVQLVEFIKAHGLMHSDRLIISRRALHVRFVADRGSCYLFDQFSAVLDEILSVQVLMLDDGVPTDYYFIHE